MKLYHHRAPPSGDRTNANRTAALGSGKACKGCSFARESERGHIARHRDATADRIMSIALVTSSSFESTVHELKGYGRLVDTESEVEYLVIWILSVQGLSWRK